MGSARTVAVMRKKRGQVQNFGNKRVTGWVWRWVEWEREKERSQGDGRKELLENDIQRLLIFRLKNAAMLFFRIGNGGLILNMIKSGHGRHVEIRIWHLGNLRQEGTNWKVSNTGFCFSIPLLHVMWPHLKILNDPLLHSQSSNTLELNTWASTMWPQLTFLSYSFYTLFSIAWSLYTACYCPDKYLHTAELRYLKFPFSFLCLATMTNLSKSTSNVTFSVQLFTTIPF